MVPCSNGHKFCVTCVQRASEVAIGEGKTGLSCLGQCEDSFELAILQRALNAHMFSKWLKKIQVRRRKMREMQLAKNDYKHARKWDSEYKISR